MLALSCNGSTGGPALSEEVDAERIRRVLAGAPVEYEPSRGSLAPPPQVSADDWRHHENGWGLVLPELHDGSTQDPAKADDAEKSLQELLAHRNGVVLRWSPALAAGYLRRYRADGSKADLNIAGGPIGREEDRVPRYLLLAGGPEALPWGMQYRLNLRHFAGRLPLTGSALSNYVDAIISNWKDAVSLKPPAAPLLWSVNHGGSDITRILAALIADPIWAAWQTDADLKAAVRLGAADATKAGLLKALRSHPPVIITTSHGRTGPAADLASGRVDLGGLQDVNFRALSAEEVTADWEPRGAIWYAHACCSAGADRPSQFAKLFSPSKDVGRTLESASAGGARVSPLPLALLGAKRPVRAFIGHVEPTFDWPLLDPNTKGALSHDFVHCLYNRLHQPNATVGAALSAIMQGAGPFFGALAQKQNLAQAGLPVEKDSLFNYLAALDRQSLVIMGDPAVSLTPETDG